MSKDLTQLLDLRVRQMHLSLEAVRAKAPESLQARIPIEPAPYYRALHLNDGMTPEMLQNQADAMLENVARIRDHLDAWCVATGVPKCGNAVLKSNRSAAIIHDLWNVAKHVELSRPPWSGEKPRLANLRRASAISSGTQPNSGGAIILNPNGEVHFKRIGDGEIRFVLSAEVLNEHGALIGSFHELCEEAVGAWEAGLQAAGVAIPSRPDSTA